MLRPPCISILLSLALCLIAPESSPAQHKSKESEDSGKATKESATKPSKKKKPATSDDQPGKDIDKDLSEEIRKAVVPDADATPSKSKGPKPAQVSSFSPDELAGFDDYPTEVQELIKKASDLTRQNLTYSFGSSDPKNGGMDCSGTIYRLLQDGGIKETPRQSDEMCRWVMKQAVLHRTEKADSFSNTLFGSMEPGDLAFWTGTYDTGALRDPPITHVMMYLGIRKKDGKPIVFGASDGRSYEGQRRCGVSAFDFVLPKKEGKATFYGYGPVPRK